MASLEDKIKRSVARTWENIEESGEHITDNLGGAAVAAAAGFVLGGPWGAAFALTQFGAAGFAESEANDRAKREAEHKAAQKLLSREGEAINTKEPTASRKLIYGDIRRMGGNAIFMETTGTHNKYLHIVYVLGDGELEHVGADIFSNIELNNEFQFIRSVPHIHSQFYNENGTHKLLDENYIGDDVDGIPRYISLLDPANNPDAFIRLKFYDGTQTKADADLVSESKEWNDSCVLNGIAYFYARLEYDTNQYPQGLPNIALHVKGRKILNPITGITEHTSNPALILYDYMTSEYGFGRDEFDETYLHEAITLCGEEVISSYLGLTIRTVAARYKFDGIIDTSRPKGEIIKDILHSMAGSLVRANGKWYLSAGQYRSSTLTLDEDDLSGGISMMTGISRSARFNQVKGTYFQGEARTLNVFDQPIPITPGGDVINEYSLVEDRDYIEADGEVIPTNLDFPHTTDGVIAQRLARIYLRASRQEISLIYPTKLTGLQVKPGDTVSINNTQFGWAEKEFRVIKMMPTFNDGTLGMNLNLVEIDADIWSDDVTPGIANDIPNTNLPSPFDIDRINITASDDVRTIGGNLTPFLIITVSHPTLSYEYEVEAKRADALEYTLIGRGLAGNFELIAEIESYDIRARAINELGIKGDWVSLTHQISSSALPADIDGLELVLIGDNVHLSWNESEGAAYYELRYSASLSATFDNSIIIISRITETTAVVPAQKGRYFIRAVNVFGNSNPTPSFIDSAGELLRTLNVVETQQQDPAFTGTKTNVARTIESGFVVLKLDTGTLFDSATGNFDDKMGLFDAGDNIISDYGEYEFASVIDLGEVFTSRVSISLDFVNINYSILFDSKAGNFDNAIGNFEDSDSNLPMRVLVYVSTTDDDPSGSPTWSAWTEFSIADLTARAMRFKARLENDGYAGTPAIKELGVSVDMPDRVEAEEITSSGTGKQSVIFNPAFKALQAIGITANMAVNERYVISERSASGFKVQFFRDSTAIRKDFDYVANGYGRQQI